MRKSGIYSITNILTGKVYYGSSNDVSKRWNSHRSKLGKGNHPNPHLQNAWNKYGADAFRFSIEEEIAIEQLQLIEQCYLDWCKIVPGWSYNIGYDAECATRGLKFGPPSNEHRRKIGMANSGERNVNFGKKLSVETRRKMSDGQRGKSKPPRTDEHRKHLSEALKGEKHPGYDHSLYTFFHSVHGIEKCNRHILISKYGLHQRGVGYIIEKKRLSYKGWKIYEC
jgi:group I intron endonuclease